MSAARYTSLGLQGMLLQPETALTAMQAVAPVYLLRPSATATFR